MCITFGGSSVLTKDDTLHFLKNYRPDKLYIHETDKGKYVTVVNEKENNLGEIQVSSRIKLALKSFYVNEKSDITRYELIKFNNEQIVEKITLSDFGLDKILKFNQLIEAINLSNVSSQQISLKDDISTSSFISVLGSTNIIDLLQNDPNLKEDIIALRHKKDILGIFENMLFRTEAIGEYCSQIGISQDKEEKVWQEFFFRNQWIFGYGLQYQFKGILQKEFYASDSKIDGSNSVICDFLLADRNFTTFVELKKPSTHLFKIAKRNRSNTWCLSTDLLDSFSQILEQKASGQVKLEKNDIFDKDGKTVTQKSIDSKVILIIGSWSEIENDTDEVKSIKKRTFEMFRRDSRNVEIITFDELYERAKFIVEALGDRGALA